MIDQRPDLGTMALVVALLVLLALGIMVWLGPGGLSLT